MSGAAHTIVLEQSESDSADNNLPLATPPDLETNRVLHHAAGPAKTDRDIAAL